MLQPLGDIKERISLAQLVQQYIASVPDDARARIVIAIHGVAKAHETVGLGPGLGGRDEARAIVALVVN
jgi:hypothetical protein